MRFVRTIALAVLATSAFTGAAQAQKTYGFGTSPTGSFYYSAGTAIAKAFIEKSGLQMRTQPYASPTQFIPIIDRGELEFGVCNAFELVWAVRGEEYFAGRTATNLRMIAVLVPLRAAMFARKDSGIRTIKDLKGHPVPTGFVSQLIIPPMQNAWFDSAGLKWADIKPVPVPNVVRAADELAVGHVDAFPFSLGAAKVQEVATVVGGLRVLPIADTPANNAIVAKYVPFAFVRVEVPTHNLVGIDEPTGVVAYDTAVFAAASVSDEAAYQLAKAIYESETDLAQSFKGLEDFKRTGMAKRLDPAQYHPGAIKFYTEAGMWPPKS